MRVILPKNLPHIAKTRCVETFDVTLEDKAEVCDGVRVNKSYRSAGQFVEAQFAPKAVKPLLFWQNKLYVLAEDGVYTLFEGEATRLVTKGGQDGSCTVFNNGVVFSGVKIGTYTLGETATLINPYGYNSVAVCGDRLVGVDERELVASDPAQPSKWLSGQKIFAHDKCSAVLSAGKQLYLLGDTCYVYCPDGEDIESQFYPFARGMGNVSPSSAVYMGDCAVFATDSGLRKMTGSAKAERIFANLTEFADFSTATACRQGNCYLVSCRRKGGAQNDITLLLDVKEGRIKGVFAEGFDYLCSDGNTVYGTRQGKLYVLEEGGNACVRFENIHFGIGRTKYLDRLYIRTRQNADVFVEADGVKRLYTLSGKNGLQSLRLSAYGKQFALELQSEDMDIDSVRLSARVYGEE